MRHRSLVVLAAIGILLTLLTGLTAFAEDAAAPVEAAEAVEAAVDVAEAAEAPTSRFYQTIWSLLPPVIAIGLALATKEVYTSLFVGIVTGGLL